MNEVGIESGDLVLFRQQSTARDGETIVALIDDEVTIKEFHRADGTIVLRPRSKNPVHKPIFLKSDFRIQGVSVHVLKRAQQFINQKKSSLQ